MKTTFIYVLIDPLTNLIRYVGKSNNPKKRLEGHLIDKAKTYKVKWIKSLQKKESKPILEVIDEVSLDQWEFWEQHYISLYKSWGFKLTNGTLGGGGSAGHAMTEEGKQHLRNINLGKVQSKETIEKRIKSVKETVEKSIEEKGYYISKEHRAAVSQSRKNKKATKESIEKRTATRKANGYNLTDKRREFLQEWKINKAHKLTKEDREKAQEKWCKPIEQFTLDGIKVAEYKSIADAKRITKIKTVSDCVQGRQKRAGKYVFKYKA